MWPGDKEPNLKAIRSQGNIKVPIPYLRWSDCAAIVVAGNRDKNVDANLRLAIDLAGTGLDRQKSYTVTDVWSSQEPRNCTAAQLGDFHCTIKRDGTAGGESRFSRLKRPDQIADGCLLRQSKAVERISSRDCHELAPVDRITYG
jgi:hypothetical protein